LSVYQVDKLNLHLIVNGTVSCESPAALDMPRHRAYEREFTFESSTVRFDLPPSSLNVPQDGFLYCKSSIIMFKTRKHSKRCFRVLNIIMICS
ncbi:MAG: hypothetical protein K2L34_05390, partial [Muribaculaceae bacterium]|nr:hypothetical protein [Muribaculaceae bacterium]